MAVRRMFAKHLIRGRRWQYRSQEKSLTAEIHLGHALCAMFFHTPRLGIAEPRAHVPDRWQLLPICMPVFDGLVAAAPLSGYVADLFLKIVETSPTGPVLPYVVRPQARGPRRGASIPSIGPRDNLGTEFVLG